MNAPTTFAAAQAPDLGRVVEIAGASAEVTFDARILALLQDDAAASPPGSIGSHVKLRVGGRWAVAQVRTLRLARAESDLVLAAIDFIGEGEEGPDGRLVDFRRGVSLLPMPGTPLQPLGPDDLAQLFAPDERPHVIVGTVHPSHAVPATLAIDALLGRHFAILGSTGAGKSTAAALLLHRLCEAAPHGHVLMLDPHGEYAAAFGDRAAVFDASNLAIPYWLMNFEEHSELLVTAQGAERQTDRDVLARLLLAARAKNKAAEGVARLTVDTPIPYLLSDLTAILAQEMGKLDKGGIGAAPFMRLKARIDEVRADPRYAFMFSGMLVADSMADVLARLLRFPVAGKPIAIVDLSAVPSEVTAVLVSLIGRLIFDHALWSRGADQRPVLLVCEEAHRYLPAEGRCPARAVLERIAKEGRKYGVGLGLVTQRPCDLAEGVLSQCGTIVAMRLNNERDQAHVRAAVPEAARGLIDAIPGLRNREAVVVGEAVPVPLRIAFATLDPDRLPASRDPVFSQAWSHESAGEDLRLERTLRRWRSQGR